MPGSVTLDLVSKAGATQSSLSGITWAWFEEDVGALLAPTDSGSGETTDGSGQISISLTNNSLTTGQVGTLVLYDSTGGKIGAYRVAVD